MRIFFKQLQTVIIFLFLLALSKKYWLPSVVT